MNKIISVILSLITAFCSFAGISAENFFDISYLENITENDVEKFSSDAGFVKNTVLLFFEEDTNSFEKISSLLKVDGIAVGALKEMNLYVIKTGNKSFDELNSMCEELTAEENIALASVCPAKKLSEQYTPNDPFNDENDYWNYDWDDENPEGNNWHIEATDTRSAWGYKEYFSHINIGVVDGGFDTEHEELSGKIIFPTKRAGRRNRPNHHGTHVAGIISARQDNNTGISGICDNSTLVCVDWSPSTNQLWIADLAVLQALREVVKGGAKVINFSVGSSSSIPEEKYKNPEIVKDIDGILYSYSMGKLLGDGYDFLVVQSAGNGNDEAYAVDATQNGLFCSINEKNAFLPFKNVEVQDLFDRIIIVGSAGVTNGAYMQSSSSNVGSRVDVCAPGIEVFSCTKDDTYGRKSGTSMAAPVVTGIASLVWSANTELTAPEVKEIVCGKYEAEVLPSDERKFENLDYMAYPMVNAKLSVEEALRKKGNFNDISVVTDGKKEITFENEKGQQFVFETNSDGTFNCVLENGNYTLKTENITKEITVSENMLIEI